MAIVIAIACIAAIPSSEAKVLQGMEDALAAQGLTGVAWTLVGEGGVVTTGAAGWRDSDAQIRFTDGTRFHVGSLTKTVLATGVLRLATQGQLDLDAPVTRYLPDLSINNPWAYMSKVTLRHLLDHTSGLGDAQMWQMFSQRADPDGPLVAAFPNPNVQLHIRSIPGARMSYSNSGYTLLGMVVEAVVGERYEDYLDKHLLMPLGMHDSTFHYTTQVGAGADKTLAWGHVDGGERYEASPIFLRPGGQFTTTSFDLSVFAQFLMGDGKLDGETFVFESLMKARGKVADTDASANGLMAGYALGLGRRDRHGVVGYCHGGNIVGFVARLCIFPDAQKAYAYSVNTDSETADYGVFDGLLISALEVAGPQPPQFLELDANRVSWHGRYIPSPNRFASYEYLDRVFGATKVFSGEGSVVIESLQSSPRRLRPVGGGVYSADDRSTASHVFYKGEGGQAFYSDGFQTFEKTSAARLFAHWISVSAGLLGLIWLLLAGSVSVILRPKRQSAKPVVAPGWICALLLFVPVPFFLTQSFMALGDVTLASALLAIVTGLLPLGMLLTLVRGYRAARISLSDRLHLGAAAMVLQWCVVLGFEGLLPFRIWA